MLAGVTAGTHVADDEFDAERAHLTDSVNGVVPTVRHEDFYIVFQYVAELLGQSCDAGIGDDAQFDMHAACQVDGIEDVVVGNLHVEYGNGSYPLQQERSAAP